MGAILGTVMKMTMHIDEALLEEVMKATGATSKTAAVDAALRKVARKFAQREQWKKGWDMSPEDIRASFDAEMALGIAPHAPSMVAETTVNYRAHGTKRPR
jgi:Arc/MetJ family transcription regulator